MDAITIRLTGSLAEGVQDLVDENPAINPHQAGRVLLWLGDKIAKNDPAWVERALRALADEKKAARRALRAAGKAQRRAKVAGPKRAPSDD